MGLKKRNWSLKNRYRRYGYQQAQALEKDRSSKVPESNQSTYGYPGTTKKKIPWYRPIFGWL